jgi:hypothetical protein
MKSKFLSLTFFISFLLISIQCNAPRNNPLDPLNPDYNYGTIEGVVQSVGFPLTGIPAVKVLWENSNIVTETDINGRFTLTSIPIKDGKIIFSKEGYKPDTLMVSWGSSKRYFAQVYFNRMPVLDTVSIYTVVVNQVILQPVFTLSVKAGINDADRNIDSVFVLNSILRLRKPLTFFPGEATYQTTITQSELNGKNIEETIGLDFSILTKDRFQNEFNIGSDRVTRIIKSEVTGLHPSTDSSIVESNQPVIFNWNEFDAGYEFSYLIEVYSYTFSNSQIVHIKSGISSDSTQYTLQQNLGIGNYYWVIWVIDKFQNRSRSKQTTFRIQPSPGRNQ